MYFDYMNDTHIDFWAPFQKNQQKLEKKTREFALSLLPEVPSNTLILGGDLGHSNRQNKWFLEELSQTYKNILLVLGNHDYYFVSKSQARKYSNSSYNRADEMTALAECLPGVKYLNGDVIEIDGKVIGGTGMWYDFKYGQTYSGFSEEQIRYSWKENSNDFHLIQGLLTFEHFTQELQKINQIIDAADIIVTHIGPDWTFSPFLEREQVHNNYYFFDGKEVLQSCKDKLWCFGHVHLELDTIKDGCRFINHGLGYPSEDTFKKFKQVFV